MDRNMIRKYISKLDRNTINNFALKNKIKLTTDELEIIYNSIKNDYEEFLSSDFYKYMEQYKKKLSENVYNKIVELYEKYKKYIK